MALELSTIVTLANPLRPLRLCGKKHMNQPAKRSWLWPAAIVALFLLLFVGAGWLARVAIRVGEVPIDTTAQPAARGGNRP